MNMKQVNVFNCWEEDVQVQPGELTDIAGKMAVLSLNVACDALKAGKLDGIVTAPFHKANVQSPEFDYTGHTPFLKQFFGLKDVTMMLVADNMKVAVLTEHIPVQAVAGAITKEAILYKLKIIQESLIQDFGISKPKIAVLGLNPHAGDGGLVGKEEIEIIAPAIKEAKDKGILCMGPYSADAFFARGQYQSFDVVLAMYHDQGLIPFKSLAFGEGINYTAGMPVIRTSPDHGTAFDIAGKGIADESSFRQAIFTCIDIYRARHERAEQTKNPLKKITAAMLRNAVDEKIDG
jgi:4-hydroxythreonine-4-phosphate dehydrogenase